MKDYITPEERLSFEKEEKSEFIINVIWITLIAITSFSFIYKLDSLGVVL